MTHSFVFTGGGTGGHIFPALAVAQVLRNRGHRILYVGTREGMEARIVPEQGYEMAFVRSGGLNRVGLGQKLRTACALPGSVISGFRILKNFGAQAVFSMGGYVAGPIMAASIWANVPLVIMEPNALPGAANRLVRKRVYKALLGFESTKAWFGPERSLVTGVPIRPAFFAVQPKRSGVFTVLITGGSRGARSLNRAVRESWPLVRERKLPIRLVLQTGSVEYDHLKADFVNASVDGDVIAFIRDMPKAFSEADLVVGRSGAGGVNEVAASGMPSILVPFPFAADDHQLKNAEVLVKAGAARLVPDQELNGERLISEIEILRRNPNEMDVIRKRVRSFAHPGAAERAADVLEGAAKGHKST